MQAPLLFFAGWLFNFVYDVKFLAGFVSGWTTPDGQRISTLSTRTSPAPSPNRTRGSHAAA